MKDLILLVFQAENLDFNVVCLASRSAIVVQCTATHHLSLMSSQLLRLGAIRCMIVCVGVGVCVSVCVCVCVSWKEKKCMEICLID